MSDIDFKEFNSFNGFHADEDEVIKITNFKSLKEFDYSDRESNYTIYIGTIDGELYWIKSIDGRVWEDSFACFGKIEDESSS